jgi:hypothetical protein
LNERIKQLAEQATSIQGPTPYNPLTFEVFDKEKFAKLMIQDCIQTLRNNGYDDAAQCLHDVHFGMDDHV